MTFPINLGLPLRTSVDELEGGNAPTVAFDLLHDHELVDPDFQVRGRAVETVLRANVPEPPQIDTVNERDSLLIASEVEVGIIDFAKAEAALEDPAELLGLGVDLDKIL